MKKIIKVIMESLEDGTFGVKDGILGSAVDYIHEDLEIAIWSMKHNGYETNGITLKKPYTRNGKKWINIHVDDTEKINMDVLMKRINSCVKEADFIFKNHVYYEEE